MFDDPTYGLKYCFETLEVGMSAFSEIEITAMRLAFFAAASTDYHPLHLNEEFARRTPFKGCIAQGMLVASFISGVIGTKLPASGTVFPRLPALPFKRPVRIGDVVRAEVKITKLIPKRTVKLRAVCTVGGKVVIEPEEEIEVTVLRHPELQRMRRELGVI